MSRMQPPNRPNRTRPPAAGVAAEITSHPGAPVNQPPAAAPADTGGQGTATWQDFIAWQGYAAEVLAAVMQGQPCPEPPSY